MKALLDRLTGATEGTPRGRAALERLTNELLKEEAADELAERTAIRADLDALNAADIDDARAFMLTTEKALETERQAEAVLNKRRAERSALECGRASRASEASRRRSLLEARLVDTASPAIAAAIARIPALVAETQARYDAVTDVRLNGYRETVWSNDESINRRITALFDMRRPLEGLKLEPLDEEGVTARVNAILASVPAVDERPAKYAGF
jgi:hypothetical protein